MSGRNASGLPLDQILIGDAAQRLAETRGTRSTWC